MAAKPLFSAVINDQKVYSNQIGYVTEENINAAEEFITTLKNK